MRSARSAEKKRRQESRGRRGGEGGGDCGARQTRGGWGEGGGGGGGWGGGGGGEGGGWVVVVVVVWLGVLDDIVRVSPRSSMRACVKVPSGDVVPWSGLGVVLCCEVDAIRPEHKPEPFFAR